MDILPFELYSHITRHLVQSTETLLSLLTVDKNFSHAALPYLYQIVNVARPNNLETWAHTAARRPSLARHTQSITFAANSPRPTDDALVANVAAALRNMPQLVELNAPSWLTLDMISSAPFKLRRLQGPLPKFTQADLISFFDTHSIEQWLNARAFRTPSTSLDSLTSISLRSRRTTSEISTFNDVRLQRIHLHGGEAKSIPSLRKAFATVNTVDTTHIRVDQFPSEMNFNLQRPALEGLSELSSALREGSAPQLRFLWWAYRTTFPLGTLEHQKLMDYLIHAFPNLETLVLDVTPQDGEESEFASQLFATLAHLRTVQFLGPTRTYEPDSRRNAIKSCTTIPSSAWLDAL